METFLSFLLLQNLTSTHDFNFVSSHVYKVSVQLGALISSPSCYIQSLTDLQRRLVAAKSGMSLAEVLHYLNFLISLIFIDCINGISLKGKLPHIGNRAAKSF